MPRLVERGPLFLLGRDHDLARLAEDDPFEHVGEVDALDLLVANRRAASSAASLTRFLSSAPTMPDVVDTMWVERHRVGERDTPSVHLEDAAPTVAVGCVHHDAAVEAPGPQDAAVEDLGAVGGGQHDHALVAGETVHLGEDLVERLLARRDR